jgi:energy-coupling factor transporter ATP-binding protein EcfA2/ABC-type multidrug transport system permease subunit
MELLTDPSVLFLDEPTSGLSSEDTLLVMRVLRKLADSGKTILLTIHQPSLEAYRLMDNVVVVAKDRGSEEPGRLAYFGPAYPNAVDFFNPTGVDGLRTGQEPSPDEVLRGLAKAPTEFWTGRYAASRFKREYVDERAGRRPDGATAQVAPKIARRIGVRQWMTLVRRYLSIKARDTWNTAILLAQAPIIGALIVLVFGEKVSDGAAAGASPSEWLSFSSACATTIFLMAISAIWFGCSNAAREIVGEWAIYHRERMVNLKIPSYVASKLAVLGGLCVVQCSVLLGIVAWGCGLEGDLAPMLGLLVLASFAGLGLGLTVSALARTSEVAIALVPLILIPMVIAGGMMKPVHELNRPMQAFADVMASRWAFEGMLLVESDARAPWTPPAPPGATVASQDLAETYFPSKTARFGVEASLAALASMFGALALAIVAILTMRDVH